MIKSIFVDNENEKRVVGIYSVEEPFHKVDFSITFGGYFSPFIFSNERDARAKIKSLLDKHKSYSEAMD